MKNLIYFCLMLALPLQAQQTLKSEIHDDGNPWNGAEIAYQEIQEKLKTIEQKMAKTGMESLTAEESQFLGENEMLQSPFATDVLGCSWYCAAAITNLSTSSILPKSKSANYEADNIHDFDLKTAWATNTNNGIGETITFDFKPSEILSVREVHFYNGYQKSEASYKNNSRVKKAALFVNGDYLFDLELEDTEALQVFQLGTKLLEGETRFTLEFKILEIYEGDKYNDLCISEINFDGAGDH